MVVFITAGIITAAMISGLVSLADDAPTRGWGTLVSAAALLPTAALCPRSRRALIPAATLAAAALPPAAAAASVAAALAAAAA